MLVSEKIVTVQWKTLRHLVVSSQRNSLQYACHDLLVKLVIKMKRSFLDIFACTVVQGLWPDFGATLKIHKKSNFDRNRLKLSMQHKIMYMYQKKL